MEGQIPYRYVSAGSNRLQQRCFCFYQIKIDLEFLEGVIISAKTFSVNLIFMRERNYYNLSDVARQADVTPNFRSMKAEFS